MTQLPPMAISLAIIQSICAKKRADLGELSLFEAYRDYTPVTWISMISLKIERCLLDFILFFK